MKAIPKFGGSVFGINLSEFTTKEEWKIIANLKSWKNRGKDDFLRLSSMLFMLPLYYFRKSKLL